MEERASLRLVSDPLSVSVKGGKVICGTYVARKLHDEHAACAGLVALGEVFWLYMNMNGGAA